jgi:hypothetical protein
MRNTMTPSRWIRGFIIAICCACGIASASASAATITLTFDNWGSGDLYPASYTEQGFIITSLYPDGGHLHNGGDSLWLHSREGSSPYQFRRTDGGSFDFLGFDYQGGDSVFVSDTGATFTILGDQPLATFTLPAAFQNVTYVNWYMNNPGDLSTPQEQWGRIDNVVMNVSAVPEPAQAALLGLGLALLLLQGRRAQLSRPQKTTAA